MKTAIVTGASGNLGKAVVKKFMHQGYYVAGTINTEGKADNTLAAESYKIFGVDLTNEDDALKFVQQIISEHKQINAAVLTVGGFVTGDVAATKISDITKQYQVNFETAYNVAKPVFEHMMQQKKGKIFLIGSKAGLNTRDGKKMIAYTLSKSLIFRLAELMNDEAKNTDVTVNVVVPSTIDTPQNREAMPDADFSKWIKPEAIADIIYWYCTNEATLIHNALIQI